MNEGYNVSKARLIWEIIGLLALLFIFNTVFVFLAYLIGEGFSLETLQAALKPEAMDTLKLYGIYVTPLGTLATVGVAVLFLNARGVEFYELGLRRPIPWKKTLVQGVVAAGLIYLMWIGMQWVLTQFGVEPNLEDFAVIKGNLLLFLYAVTGLAWVSAGFGEEVLFRGFLMHNFQALFGKSKFSWGIANVSQAAVFGLLHFNQGWGGVIPIFIIGVLFGAIFLKAGKSLWPLIVAHGLVDTVSLTLLYFGVMGS